MHTSHAWGTFELSHAAPRGGPRRTPSTIPSWSSAAHAAKDALPCHSCRRRRRVPAGPAARSGGHQACPRTGSRPGVPRRASHRPARRRARAAPVLSEHHVTERAQRRRLLHGEEAQRRRGSSRAMTTSAGRLIPVFCGGEHVVVGVAPDHLRRRALTLTRQPVRLGRLAAGAQVRQMPGFAQVGHPFSPPVAKARRGHPSRRRSTSAQAP